MWKPILCLKSNTESISADFALVKLERSMGLLLIRGGQLLLNSRADGLNQQVLVQEANLLLCGVEIHIYVPARKAKILAKSRALERPSSFTLMICLFVFRYRIAPCG